MIFVLEEVMHAQPEIFQAELAKVLSSNSERIEVVLFEISPKFAPTFLVFAPHKADAEKKCRHDDRRDHVDPKFALQGVNHDCVSIIHAREIYDTWPAKAMRRRIALPKRFARSLQRGFVSRSFRSAYASSPHFSYHRFPTRLESVMFSTSVSVGRAKANATASATCVAFIMRSRGHFPSTWLQMSVSVAAG